MTRVFLSSLDGQRYLGTRATYFYGPRQSYLFYISCLFPDYQGFDLADDCAVDRGAEASSGHIGIVTLMLSCGMCRPAALVTILRKIRSPSYTDLGGLCLEKLFSVCSRKPAQSALRKMFSTSALLCLGSVLLIKIF